MRVIHVVGTISVESSGPSQSVAALSRGLAAQGVDVELHYLDYGARPAVPDVRTVVHRRSSIPGLRFADWNTNLLRALWHRAKPGTVFHAHGLWHFPAIYPAWVGRIAGIPWVCSPRGTLGPWALARSRRLKSASLLLGQRVALERAAFIHATSDSEAEDVRRFGIRSPVVVVPNAVVLPTLHGTADRARQDLLFLSRLHPIKGLDRLVDAWALVAPAFPASSLAIAGPSEGGYGETIEATIAQRRIPRVRFLGPVQGEAKWEALIQARALVLPSHSENFAMVVAEALGVGTPVIASKGTPWSSLTTSGAGWWIENSVPELAATLRECLSEPVDVINRRGEHGRRLIADYCSPRTTAQAMVRAYSQALRAAQGLSGQASP